MIFVAAGGAAVVLCLAAICVFRPRLALVLLVTLDSTNVTGVIEQNVGISPYKPLLALGLLAAVVMIVRRQVVWAWSPVLTGALVLLAGWALTLFVTDDAPTSMAMLTSRIRDLAYLVVVYLLLVSTRSWRQLAGLVVAAFAGLAGLTLVHQFGLHNQGDLFGLSRVPLVAEDGALTPRHAGTSSDVNFWARLLLLMAPLALSFVVLAVRRSQRLFWLGATGALVVGVYLTQSRGGFLALSMGLLVWFLLAGPGQRRLLAYAPVVLAVVIPVSGIAARLSTLASFSSTGDYSTQDPSLVTRARMQHDAWLMFLDHPVLGHGIGTYGSIFDRYDRYSGMSNPIDIVVAAHNFYLEQAADGGIVLLFAWTVFFGAVITVLLRTMKRAAVTGQETERLMAVGLLAGLAGWSVASVFLHISDLRTLLLFAALAGAMDVHVRRAALVSGDVAAARPVGPWLHRSVAATALVAIIAANVIVLPTRTSEVQASQLLAVVATGRQSDWTTAYRQDLLSRGITVPTIARAVGDDTVTSRVTRRAGLPETAVDVSVTVSRLSGALKVTVSGAKRDDVALAMRAAITETEIDVNRLDMPWTIATSGTAQYSSPAVPLVGVLLMVAGLLMAGAATLLRRRDETPPGDRADVARSPAPPADDPFATLLPRA